MLGFVMAGTIKLWVKKRLFLFNYIEVQADTILNSKSCNLPGNVMSFASCDEEMQGKCLCNDG